MAERVLAVTHIHGLAGRRDELRELMRVTEAATRQEPGCRTYRFAAGLDDADEYLHVQEWESETHFRAHQSSDAFSAYQRGLFDLLARPSAMAIHRTTGATVPQPSAPLDPRSAD
jgi:quinol monooxygenase YgiN